MRVCPRCRGRYDDDALVVCPRDGSPLIETSKPGFQETGGAQGAGSDRGKRTVPLGIPERAPEGEPRAPDAARRGDLLDEVAALMADGRSTSTGSPDTRNPDESRPVQRIGEVLGSYRLIELIGHGGMGWVYRAEHVKLGRQVALKLLRSNRSGRRDAVARFFQEARTVNRIRHRNIVDITDLVELEGATFIIMELLSGLTLGDWVRLNPDETSIALDLALQICDGLAAAHRLGVVHRDLKPDNIIVVPTDEGELVKLLDFGIAKLLSDEELGPETGAGTVMGTPAYMSPEQAGGLPVDARSDIYSLGAILYEMFTRERVFHGKSLGEYVRKHLNVAPRPPSQTRHGDGIDPRLETIILRCLAKRPEGRYASVDALRAELAGLRAFDRVTGMDGLRVELATVRQLERAISAAERSSGLIRVEAPGATSPTPAMHRSGSTTESRRMAALVTAASVKRGVPWVLAGAVALLVYGSWSVYEARRHGPPGDPISAQAAPAAAATAPGIAALAVTRDQASVTVQVDSMPSAEVRLDGLDAPPCRTPCALTVPPDAPRSTLAFRAEDHRPVELLLDPEDPPQLVYVRLEQLDPEASATGSGEDRPGAGPAHTGPIEPGQAGGRAGHRAASQHRKSGKAPQKRPDGSPPRQVQPTETLDPFGTQ